MLRSLALYIGMTGVLLFAIVQIISYGNQHLHAPADISGRYTLAGIGAPLCAEGADRPVLVIGQSGTFLNADLLGGGASSDLLSRANKGNGKLHGRISAGVIQLEGSAEHLGCLAGHTLRLEATVSDHTLQGQLAAADQRVAISGSK